MLLPYLLWNFSSKYMLIISFSYCGENLKPLKICFNCHRVSQDNLEKKDHLAQRYVRKSFRHFFMSLLTNFSNSLLWHLDLHFTFCILEHTVALNLWPSLKIETGVTASSSLMLAWIFSDDYLILSRFLKTNIIMFMLFLSVCLL